MRIKCHLMPRTPEYLKQKLLVCGDATDIAFDSSPFNHIQGITVDIENILTDGISGGDPTVRPEALEALDRARFDGKRLALLTNCTRLDFVEAVAEQVAPALGSTSTPVVNSEVGSKHHRRAFDIARKQMDIHASHQMAHIDDQLKSHLGAWSAGYGLMVLTKPYGEFQHTWVRRTRPLERIAVRSLLLLPGNRRA